MESVVAIVALFAEMAGPITAYAAFTHFVFAVVVFAGSAHLTRYMIRLNIADVPNERSSHARATPKSGGVAIAGAFFAGMAGLYILSDIARLPTWQFVAFLATSGAMFGASLLDDLAGLRASMKLAIQIGCASAFSLFVAHIDGLSFPVTGNISFGPLGYALTVLWMIFFMNAFNFMDGINGLAGGGALIASAFLFLISLYGGAHFVYLSALCLFAAVLGFFVYNFPYGKIFMGDTGSQIIGFVMSGLAVIAARADMGQVSVVVVPVLFGCFIFDVSATLIYRLLRGKNLTEAHREHLYQIANRLGFSHIRVSALYFALFVMSGLFGMLIQAADPAARPVLMLGCILVFAPLGIMLYAAGLREGVADLSGGNS